MLNRVASKAPPHWTPPGSLGTMPLGPRALLTPDHPSFTCRKTPYASIISHCLDATFSLAVPAAVHTAVRQGRAGGRVRHRDRDVQERRSGGAAAGQDGGGLCGGQRGGHGGGARWGSLVLSNYCITTPCIALGLCQVGVAAVGAHTERGCTLVCTRSMSPMTTVLL